MGARPLGFHRGDENPDQPTPPKASPEAPMSLPELREACLAVLGEANLMLGDALEQSQGAEAPWHSDRHMLALVVRHLADALDEIENLIAEES
jgi:hypothetical protein